MPYSNENEKPYSYNFLTGHLTGRLTFPTVRAPSSMVAGLTGVARLMSSRTVQPGYGAATGSNGTTDIDSNTRSSHFNELGVTVNKLKLLYANWYCRSGTTPAEVAGPNDFTVNASIEYPVGVFSASVPVVVTAGNNVFSAEITPSAPIPTGAQFWVRTFVQVTSGQKWQIGYAVNTGASFLEASDRNTGTDLTQGGTISGSNSGCGPIAIVATNYLGAPAIAFAGFGDSLTEGGSVSIQDIHLNIGPAGFAMTGNAPYMNLGRGGLLTSASAASMAKRLDAMVKAGVTDVIVTLGTNDFQSGGAVATLETDLQTTFDTIAAAGMRVRACTLPPNATFTTGKPPVPNSQVTTSWSSAGGASKRGLLNAWLRTANNSIYSVVDVGDQVETARDSGLWKTDADTTNARILGPVNATVTGSPTTTVIPTDLVSGYGINHFSAHVSAVLFTSGVNNGLIRSVLSNTNNGASLTLSAALPSAPSAGDTMVIYRDPYTFEGTHTQAMGHNSILTTAYYGGSFVVADYIANLFFGRNATT